MSSIRPWSDLALEVADPEQYRDYDNKTVMHYDQHIASTLALIAQMLAAQLDRAGIPRRDV